MKTRATDAFIEYNFTAVKYQDRLEFVVLQEKELLRQHEYRK